MSDPEKPSDNRCMTYKAFDQFSTPSRDKRLIDSIVLARAYYGFGLKKNGARSFSAANLKIYKAMFPYIQLPASEEASKDDAEIKSNFCTLEIPEVGFLSLAHYKRRVFSNRFSSNPNDSYTVRFGSAKTAKDLGRACPTYDLTEKNYNLNQIEEDMMREVLTSPIAL